MKDPAQVEAGSVNERSLVCFVELLRVGAVSKRVNSGSHAAQQTQSGTAWGRARCRVRICAGSGSEWFSTEQPVRHNTGHQQSLPHTGYQHGTALGTRSVLLEASSKPGSGRNERSVGGVGAGKHPSESGLLGLCSVCVRMGVSGCEAAYLLLVQLEGGLDQVPQGCELLLLLVLSLFDLKVENAKMRKNLSQRNQYFDAELELPLFLTHISYLCNYE